jgi:hypothetical protein
VPHRNPHYSGFHLDPELASRDEGAPREGRTQNARGGAGRGGRSYRSQNLKILIFSARDGHFGLLKFRLEPEFLDTEFRHVLALNGRNFGVNAHSAANPTPNHQLKGPT